MSAVIEVSICMTSLVRNYISQLVVVLLLFILCLEARGPGSDDSHFLPEPYTLMTHPSCGGCAVDCETIMSSNVCGRWVQHSEGSLGGGSGVFWEPQQPTGKVQSSTEGGKFKSEVLTVKRHACSVADTRGDVLLKKMSSDRWRQWLKADLYCPMS